MGLQKMRTPFSGVHMSYSLNSVKGIIWGTTAGVIKGDTKSSDYSSYNRNVVYFWTYFWAPDLWEL